MKTFFFILNSLLFVTFDCFSQNGLLDERDKRYYREIISLYPKALVSHFPKNIDNKTTGAPDLLFPRGKYLSYIHLGLSFDNKKIKRIKEEIGSKAKGVYHYEDSCLILPYDYKEFKIVTSDSIRNLPFANLLPIPNFKFWEGGITPDFCKEAVIYLLDAEKGRFLSDDCLSKSGVGLPKEWLHGYTKGFILYKNYVIYWLEVW